MSEDSGRLVGGRYRLGEVLGRGGMGTVWAGEDEILGRKVAVKELRFPSSVDEDEKQRLITRTLREAKAIARIRSRSAITVFDVVNEDDRPWIVMELVEGRSLADHIRKDGPLTPRRAAEVGLAILDVLRAAHREGILHRDVKPSNVLIEENTGRVVLTDFGIAKVEGDPSVTSTGMLVGAPSYISPERARGNRPGPPADLWSLGGLLFAAVEGRPPYDKGSAISTLTAVMTEPVPQPRNAGELREAIYGLLTKDPDKRLDVDGARALLEPVASAAASAPAAGREADREAGARDAGGAGAAAAGDARTRPEAPSAEEAPADASSDSSARVYGRRRGLGLTGSGERLFGAFKKSRTRNGAAAGGAAAGGAAAGAAGAAAGATESPADGSADPSAGTSGEPSGEASAGEAAASPSAPAAEQPAAPPADPAPEAPAGTPRDDAARSGRGPATDGEAPAAGKPAAGKPAARTSAAKKATPAAPAAPVAAAAGAAAPGAAGARTPARTAPAGAAEGGAGSGGPSALPGFLARFPARALGVAAVALIAVVVLAVVLVVNAVGGDGGSGKQAEGSGGASSGDAGGGPAEGKDHGKDGGAGRHGEEGHGGSGSSGADDGSGDGDGSGQGSGSGSGSGSGKGGGDGSGDGSGESGKVPPGYETVVDHRFHFKVALPEGFHRVDIAGSNSGGVYSAGGLPKIQFDYSPHPLSDAAKGWRDEEPAVRSQSSGYRRISLKPIEWRGYKTVADWEFERTEDNGRVHALNRGFQLDPSHGYSIFITCKADEWDGKECRTLRETAFATFASVD